MVSNYFSNLFYHGRYYNVEMENIIITFMLREVYYLKFYFIFFK